MLNLLEVQEDKMQPLLQWTGARIYQNKYWCKTHSATENIVHHPKTVGNCIKQLETISELEPKFQSALEF